jgi:hypothetical protein
VPRPRRRNGGACARQDGLRPYLNGISLHEKRCGFYLADLSDAVVVSCDDSQEAVTMPRTAARTRSYTAAEDAVSELAVQVQER